MGYFGYRQFAERHRPHIHPPGTVLFVTYRLAGSIPKSTVRQYRALKEWLTDQLKRAQTSELRGWMERVEKFNREWFVKFEEILHNANTGPMWMQDERVAAKVAESLKDMDGKSYRLDAYSIMSNHVHAVLKPFLSEDNLSESRDDRGHPIFVSEFPSLARIMQILKGRSARECNLLLSRGGQFWDHESFDHVVRPGKFDKTVNYVLNNPVKAGLVKQWRDWPWNFCRDGLGQRF